MLARPLKRVAIVTQRLELDAADALDPVSGQGSVELAPDTSDRKRIRCHVLAFFRGCG
jgi:hypothetical protein